MKQSPPDSPFAWISYEGSELETLPKPRQGNDWKPPGCFDSRDLLSPPVTVAVGADEIWIVDQEPQRLGRVVRFPAGFPSFRSSLSALGNSCLLAIASNGSVAFHAGGRLYFWQLSSGEVRFVAQAQFEPEQLVLSPAGLRVATLSHGAQWVARVWSVTDGKLLATLHWDSQFPGSLSEFEFSPDGDGLSLSTDVSAQSGADFTEHHGWSIGAGPESA